MTTNSPNPVDGDVQSLIRNIQRRIKNTKRWLSANKSIGNPESEAVELILIYETALAALTAEPVADVVTWIHPHEERRCAVQLRKFDLVPGHLYTTPPAQLLRPVELPHTYSPALSSVLKNSTDGVAVMRCDKNGKWINKTAVIEALRQQGYEVKND